MPPTLWFGASSWLPQKQSFSATLVGGGRLPTAGDHKLAAASLHLGWVTITAWSSRAPGLAKRAAAISQTQHWSMFSVSQPALRHAALFITTWMGKRWMERRTKKQEFFRSNPTTPGTSLGAFVPMSSKGRSIDMQAMLSNATSTFAQEHERDDLPQPVHQQSQA